MGIAAIVVFCIFAFYGLYQMIKDVMAWRKKKDCAGIDCAAHLAVTVKDQEDTVEGVVRSLAWNMMSEHESCCVRDMIIIDMGSGDGTLEIVKKLAEEYKFIKVMTREEYVEIISAT